MTIEAKPSEGYYFRYWEQQSGHDSSKIETSEKLTLIAKEDVMYKAYFAKYDSKYSLELKTMVLSKDGKYIAKYSDNRIEVIEVDGLNILLTHELEEGQALSLLDWGNNNVLYFETRNKLYQMDLDGNTLLLKDLYSLYQGIFTGKLYLEDLDENDLIIFCDDLGSSKFSSGDSVGQLYIFGYINSERIFQLEESIIGVLFSKPIVNQDITRIAMTIEGYRGARIYNLDNREVISIEHRYDTEPLHWKDSNSLIIQSGTWIGGMAAAGEVLIYDLTNDRLALIYEVEKEMIRVTPDNFSPNSNKLLANDGQMILIEIDYNEIQEKDLDNKFFYTTEIAKLGVGAKGSILSDVFWIDNNSAIFALSDTFTSPKNVYILNSRETHRILDNVTKLIGVTGNDVIYYKDDEIRKFTIED